MHPQIRRIQRLDFSFLLLSFFQPDVKLLLGCMAKKSICSHLENQNVKIQRMALVPYTTRFVDDLEYMRYVHAYSLISKLTRKSIVSILLHLLHNVYCNDNIQIDYLAIKILIRKYYQQIQSQMISIHSFLGRCVSSNRKMYISKPPLRFNGIHPSVQVI